MVFDKIMDSSVFIRIKIDKIFSILVVNSIHC